MLKPRYAHTLRRDIKLLKKRQYDMAKFAETVTMLVQDKGMPEKYRDHPLKGNWLGFRECHLEPDWLLIYEVNRDNQILTLTRTGTHSDLY
jgi:mRNA interferase YafQ